MSANRATEKGEDIEQPTFYYVRSQPYGMIHDVYLYDINEPREFTGLVSLFRHASESDIIKIYINSSGGHLSTGMQLLNAIEGCQATIVTILDGDASSMAGLLFLAGDEMVVPDNCALMLHNFSLGMFAKGQDFLNFHQSTQDTYNKMVEKYAARVLTASEISNMMKGEDIYLTSVELGIRLAKFEKKTLLEQKKAAKNEK